MLNSRTFYTNCTFAYSLLIVLFLASCSIVKDSETQTEGDQVSKNKYGATIIGPLDTIHIGSGRSFESLEEYFATDGGKAAKYIIVHEGTYYCNQLWIDGQNLVIEGQGQVNLYCKTLYENVMWIAGSNIHVKNIHMKHFVPGSTEGQNCSGRVIGFDNAHNITIEQCDLNGCGLAALHDNLGNSNILIKNNYIHNNSVGAYTNIDGEVWMEAIDDHPVFHFEKNRVKNNGPERTPEGDHSSDYIVSCPSSVEDAVIQHIDYLREEWKEVPNPLMVRYRGSEMGDYYHLWFEDENGKRYDFGDGNNDFGDLQSFFEDHNFVYDPEDPSDPLYKLSWNWKVASFPCCSGEYEPVEAYIPSITKIERIKD